MANLLSTSDSAQYSGDEIKEPSPEKRKIDDDDKESKKEDNQRKSEERHFLQLYTQVLNDFISEKNVPEADIADSIKSISDAFIVDSRCERFKFDQLDFTEWENVCAYLYRYGSHGAGFARNRIWNAFEYCEDLEPLQKASHLQVVCLGGGPGNDAIGLCSALAEWKRPIELTVKVVDKIAEWNFCVQSAIKLIQEGNFGNVSELFKNTDVQVSFAVVDLPGNEELDTEYFESLKEADVIVISKLLSILNWDDCKDIIKSLKRRMKQGAFIFLMDQYYEGVWRGFEVIYTWGADKGDVYQSTARAEPRFGAADDMRSKFAIRILRSQSVKSREI